MKSGSSRRIANDLVALSSAAVLTVYAAGYMKTRAAAERLQNAGKREIAPVPLVAPNPIVEPKPAPAKSDSAKPTPAPAKAAPTKAAPAKPAPAAPTSADPVAVAAPAAVPVQTEATAAPPATPPPASTVPPDVDPKAAEPPAPKPAAYKDGTYVGWGTSRHGSIEATVTIRDGKIVASVISQCLTRYSCAVIAHLVPQVVARQSANVDYVSGATQSTYAFYDAVVEALSKAK